MVEIRVDANTEIATGHMMRCMTIARELIKRQEPVRFLVSNEASVRLLKENELPYHILHTDFRQLYTKQELVSMKQILEQEYVKQQKRPLLFVDSYFVTKEYFQELRPYARLGVIDDLQEEIYAVDLLINYSMNDPQSYYKERYSGSDTRLLIGPYYTPLREQFQIPCRYQERLAQAAAGGSRLQVLVICGGGDTGDFLFPFLEYAIKQGGREEYEFHVVLGAYNPYRERILNLAKSVPCIHTYQNVRNMAELMGRCDVAVSAAGTVLYECCGMGLPTIFFCLAENQVTSIAAFSRDNRMLYAGDLRKDKDAVIRKIGEELHRLKDAPELRSRMSKQTSSLVDGYGASRIVDAMQEILEEKGATED